MAQIDWELIRRRMLIYKYQPGYFTGTAAPGPCDNWILNTGLWNDSKLWIDTCNWDDGPSI